MSESQIQYLTALPGGLATWRGLTLAMIKNAMHRSSGNPEELARKIPAKTLRVTDVRLDALSLEHYRRLCGFPPSLRVPATFLHLPAFPLHLSLISDSDFPLPLAGLVHLRNRITQFRPVSEDELLDYQTSLLPGVVTEKGIEFDLVTEIEIGGNLVWREVSTNLYRIRSDRRAGAKNPKAYRDYKQANRLSLPEDLGRRYARVSRDFNPIHLYAWTAKPLGFSRAIMHGMWTHARSLAELYRELPETWFDEAIEMEVSFKLPVFLPSEICLNWQFLEGSSQRGVEIAVTDAARQKPHLTGTLKHVRADEPG